MSEFFGYREFSPKTCSMYPESGVMQDMRKAYYEAGNTIPWLNKDLRVIVQKTVTSLTNFQSTAHVIFLKLNYIRSATIHKATAQLSRILNFWLGDIQQAKWMLSSHTVRTRPVKSEWRGQQFGALLGCIRISHFWFPIFKPVFEH